MNKNLGEHFRTYWLHYILIAVCLVVFVLGGRNLYVLFLLIIAGFGILLKRIKPQEVFCWCFYPPSLPASSKPLPNCGISTSSLSATWTRLFCRIYAGFRAGYAA